MELIVATLIALVAGIIGGFIFGKSKNIDITAEAESRSAEIIEAAKKESISMIREAKLASKEELLKLQSDFEKKAIDRNREFDQLESRLINREKTLDRKLEQVERRDREFSKREKRFSSREQELEQKHAELEHIKEESIKRLEEVAHLSSEEAKTELKDSLLYSARMESISELKDIEENTKKEATEKAGRIIAEAVNRYANDFVAENTVSVVDLPSDEMKGRIIGREGRNIRALEIATGVDLIVDDTPNAVVLSCFDPIKREIARMTLTRLIKDGRIHPGRIEETVEKATKDLGRQIKEDGEKACFELGLDGIHPEIVKTLGKLKFRKSYSQNVLKHSIECGFLCGMMAQELGQNVKLARRAGLLHDIGKAIDQTMEGTHTQIGVDMAKRYNEPKVVINSIASHHEDVPAESIIAVLVAASDALSASRPGARREMMQNYINRMEKLEEIGNSFHGVNRTFAIQAGREVRVVVTPESVRDSEAYFMAKDIAKKIEGELAYPGEIKVTVIRETRVTDFAR